MSALLPQTIINGLMVGAIYGLLGTSLTLLYGVMRIVNLAHGDLIVVGSYIAFVLSVHTGFHPFVAVIVAFFALAVLGALIYLGAVRRIQNAAEPETASFLMFYGLSLMITAVLLQIFDADTRSISFQFEPLSFEVAGIYISHARVFAIAVELAILAGLFWFLFRTLLGKALRGAAMNRDALRIIGVNVDRLSLVAFAVSIGLAGATGVLLALVFPAFGPVGGLDYTIIGFIVIVLGGLGHPLGALLGGLIFGLSEQISTLYLGQSVGLIVGFLILVVVISVRPQGLLGRSAWHA